MVLAIEWGLRRMSLITMSFRRGSLLQVDHVSGC